MLKTKIYAALACFAFAPFAQAQNYDDVIEASLITERDGRIAASLADRAYSGAEAGAQNVRCRITPSTDGVTLETTLNLPRVGRSEAMIIEAANPLLWIAQPKIKRSGNTLSAVTQIQHVESAPFLLNRSALRITVLTDQRAVEIAGCKGG